MAYQLAQLNIARFKQPKDHPANADFINALDRINAIAEAHPGFVWRLTGDGNNAMDIQPFPDVQSAVNMSVWRDLESLAEFVYRDESHKQIMRRRREWFERMEVFMVLWWVREGTRPTVAEALERLEWLKTRGPGPDAFTFQQPFAPPGGSDVAPIMDECA